MSFTNHISLIIDHNILKKNIIMWFISSMNQSHLYLIRA